MTILVLLAALAVDSVTGTAPNATTPLSQITACVSPCTQTPSFTNTAGTFLVCGLAGAVTTGSSLSFGSVTYGGDAMTLEQSTSFNTTADVTALYSRLSPKTGANNLSFTVTNGGSFDRVTAGCISFTGNDAVTPVVAATKFTGTSASTATIGGTMTSTTAGNILVMVAQGGFGSISAGPTGTAIYTGADDGGSGGGKQMMQRRAAGGSVILTWTQTADSEGAAGIEVQASGGAPAGPVESGMRGFWGLLPMRQSDALVWARKEEEWLAQR